MALFFDTLVARAPAHLVSRRTMMAVADEQKAFDYYSHAVMTAAERAGPAVVKVEIGHSNGRRASGQGQGIGSGVIYSSAGYILTNAHVVAGAERGTPSRTTHQR